MSQRRMFSPDIVESEEFITMPISSQALYFHLCMNADDDGFVQPQKIMRMINSSGDDLKVLLAKRFLLSFETGVVVIKHWLIHNMIRADRYKETRYIEEKNTLIIKENKSYSDGLHSGNQMATQVRLGKDSIGNNTDDPKVSYGEFKNVKLTNQEYDKLTIKYGTQINRLIEELSSYLAQKNKKYLSHYATLLTWARNKKIEVIKSNTLLEKYSEHSPIEIPKEAKDKIKIIFGK